MGQWKRVRRSFTPEFKAEAVRVVQRTEKTIGSVARDLDLTETALRRWVEQSAIDAGTEGAGALTSDECTELVQLRREVRTLRMERDILKKATMNSTGHCDTVSPGVWQKGTVQHAGIAAGVDGQ